MKNRMEKATFSFQHGHALIQLYKRIKLTLTSVSEANQYSL
jgi:hypothetical protein